MKKAAVSEYGYINAKLRSKISLILTEEFCRALTGASNIEEAVHVLANSGFNSASEVWDSTADIQNVEFELFCKHIENHRMVMKHTEGDLHDFVSILSMKPEIENIKSALRLWYGSKIRKPMMIFVRFSRRQYTALFLIHIQYLIQKTVSLMLRSLWTGFITAT